MYFVKGEIQVYKAIGGWQTRLIGYFPEEKIWDVVQTGLGPYPTIEEAKADARAWSEAEGLLYLEEMPK